jgi:hypothetical protein
MRFLDRNWIEGKQDPLTRHLHVDVYMRHLLDIATELPHGAKTFALLSAGQLLFGSEIVATQYAKEEKRFTLILRIEGAGGEYFFELEYEGVDPEQCELEPLDFGESCLTEEFDLGPDGLLEHRILLEPEGEAVIRFNDLKFHAKRAE